MIDRLLEKQEHSLASLKNSHVLTHQNSGVESMASSVPQVSESQSVLGASLSSAARVRFERLKYRIRLYALSEIDECVSQKESLVMMVSLVPAYFTSKLKCPLSTELQSHRHQRVLLRRASHKSHPTARQGHHTLYACQFDDCILLLRPHRRVFYQPHLLDLFRYHHGPKLDRSLRLQHIEWHDGR